MQNNLVISKQLRGRFGSASGYQIKKIKRPRKNTPSWTLDDLKVRKIILRSFPRMKTDVRQRMAAGRWAAILYYYYRQNYSRGQIAKELNLSYNVVNTTIRRILWAAIGQRQDGKGKLRRPAKHDRMKT